MGLTEAKIASKLFRLLIRHASSAITIAKYTSMTQDRYRQGAVTYATAVTVVGRVIVKPSKIMLTFIGDATEVDALFIFDRNHLRAAFPSLAEGEWITTKDRIRFGSREYELLKADPSGKSFGTDLLFVAPARIPPGQRNTSA